MSRISKKVKKAIAAMTTEELFDLEPDEPSKLVDLRNRRLLLWPDEKPKKTGKGRPQGANPFNSPINAKLNKGRALANSLEIQHRRSFG